MKRHILLAVALIMMSLRAFAAPGDIECHGQIIDDLGEPVIGATISVDGTTLAVFCYFIGIPYVL